MHLTPHELDKLTLHQAGALAQKRLARGVRLNQPEAVALIATQILEFIRDGRETIRLEVKNTGDRPIQVGSHYHFVETNRALVFDRRAAHGKRLDIPAGTAVRFEPGETKTVSLVPIAGARVIRGGNAVADGEVSEQGRARAI